MSRSSELRTDLALKISEGFQAEERLHNFLKEQVQHIQEVFNDLWITIPLEPFDKSRYPLSVSTCTLPLGPCDDTTFTLREGGPVKDSYRFEIILRVNEDIEVFARPYIESPDSVCLYPYIAQELIHELGQRLQVEVKYHFQWQNRWYSDSPVPSQNDLEVESFPETTVS